MIRKYKKEITPQKKGQNPEKYRLRILHRSPLSGVSLSDLKPHHITRFREDRLKEVSVGTVLKDLGLLSAVINTGRTEWGLENVIRTNPVSLISKPKTPRPRDRRLEAGELERLPSACTSPNPWFRPLVLFAIETGMRRGEIHGLSWEDVDLKNSRITLFRTKNGERRVVPLVGKAYDLIKNLYLKLEPGNKDLLFPSPNNPKNSTCIRTAWCTAIKRAEIENFRFHDLRHSKASYLAMNGASLLEIADILGHKTLQMVKRYSHL